MLSFDVPEFRPHPLVLGSHAQTLLAAYLPGKLLPYSARRHQVSLPDGDQVVLHDDCPANWQAGQAVALLLHGLAGCHSSPYLVRISAKLNERGVRTFRMDLRGCGAGFPLAARPFHAGQSDDAKAAMLAVARITEGSALSLIGFSLSGNIVLKLVGELGEEVPPYLRRVVAIGPPIDLLACAENLRRGWGRIYDRAFLKTLQQMRRQRAQAGYRDIPAAEDAKRLYDFDHHYTAPLGGFADAADYYVRSSAGPLLHRVRVPTLIITSADDPLVPVAPFHRAILSQSVQLHITDQGGHLGFLASRGSDPDRRWMDWRIVQTVIHDSAANGPQNWSKIASANPH